MSEGRQTNFDRLGPAFSKRGWANDGRMRDLLASAFKSFPPGLWLDAGCGVGDFASAIGRDDVTILGADLSLAMTSRARRSRAVSLTVRSDATFLPFRASSFDLVACRNVLKHCVDLSSALGEMVRVCKESGWLVIVESCCADWRDKAFMDDLIQIAEPEQRPHLTGEEWLNTLEDQGVQVKRSFLFRHRVRSTIEYRREQFGMNDDILRKHWLHFSGAGEHVRELRCVSQRPDGLLEFDLLWVFAAGQRRVGGLGAWGSRRGATPPDLGPPAKGSTSAASDLG